MTVDRDDLKYAPGDVIMIQPKNNHEEITKFIERLGYKNEHLLSIKLDQSQTGQVSQSSVMKFPENGITIFELFSYWINLMEPPSRYFMYVLSHFVKDEIHKEKLIEFSSNTVDGKSEYYRYSVREKRTVIEVLYDFFPGDTAIVLPLSYLI